MLAPQVLVFNDTGNHTPTAKAGGRESALRWKADQCSLIATATPSKLCQECCAAGCLGRHIQGREGDG